MATSKRLKSKGNLKCLSAGQTWKQPRRRQQEQEGWWPRQRWRAPPTPSGPECAHGFRCFPGSPGWFFTSNWICFSFLETHLLGHHEDGLQSCWYPDFNPVDHSSSQFQDIEQIGQNSRNGPAKAYFRSWQNQWQRTALRKGLSKNSTSKAPPSPTSSPTLFRDLNRNPFLSNSLTAMGTERHLGATWTDLRPQALSAAV